MRPRRPVQPDDDPVTRCGRCGYARNPYRHSKCPPCYVRYDGGYWLGCDECGYDWLTEDPPIDAECPRCEAPSHAVAEVSRREP